MYLELHVIPSQGILLLPTSVHKLQPGSSLCGGAAWSSGLRQPTTTPAAPQKPHCASYLFHSSSIFQPRLSTTPPPVWSSNAVLASAVGCEAQLLSTTIQSYHFIKASGARVFPVSHANKAFDLPVLIARSRRPRISAFCYCSVVCTDQLFRSAL